VPARQTGERCGRGWRRLKQALQLRVKDLGLKRLALTVADGKGGQDIRTIKELLGARS
jgi:hypothetical protein